MKQIGFKRVLLIGSMLLMLFGCNSGKQKDLTEYIKRVNSRKIGQIEALPEVKPYERFTYSASGLRSPFAPPAPEAVAISLSQDNGISPDFERRKESLEAFPMDSLKMVGTIEQDSGIWVVIVDSDRIVHRITKGNYVGQNHGKIEEITEEKISVTEIVPNGIGGWQERKASMLLLE